MTKATDRAVSLTDDERDRIGHALMGGERKTRYRNHYATSAGSPDLALWSELERRGLAVAAARPKLPTDVMTIFNVTAAGIEEFDRAMISAKDRG